MWILSAAKSISRDMPGIYPSMVVQTNCQRQTKSQHTPWLNSEYQSNINIPHTDGSSSGRKFASQQMMILSAAIFQEDIQVW
jgi:hypothetical protein